MVITGHKDLDNKVMDNKIKEDKWLEEKVADSNSNKRSLNFLPNKKQLMHSTKKKMPRVSTPKLKL